MSVYKAKFSLNEQFYKSYIEAYCKDNAKDKLVEYLEDDYPDKEVSNIEIELVSAPEMNEGDTFVYDGVDYEVLSFEDGSTICVKDIDTNEISFFVIDPVSTEIVDGPFDELPDDSSEDQIVDEAPLKGTEAEPLEAGQAAGFASMINSLIIDEYEAIEGYNSAMVMAQGENRDDIISVLADIQKEEHTHIGQLQELLKLFDPNADSSEAGQKEAETQLSEEDDLTIDELQTIETQQMEDKE